LNNNLCPPRQHISILHQINLEDAQSNSFEIPVIFAVVAGVAIVAGMPPETLGKGTWFVFLFTLLFVILVAFFLDFFSAS
jgi:uncharacterized MAPEG superfamily protein